MREHMRSWDILDQFGTGTGNSDNWLNVLNQTLRIGYEYRINDKWSVTPSVGLFLENIEYVTRNLVASNYLIAQVYGYKMGFSLTRHFAVGPEGVAFIRLGNEFCESDLNRKIASLGSMSYTASLSFGFKLTKKGVGILLNALSKAGKHKR